MLALLVGELELGAEALRPLDRRSNADTMEVTRSCVLPSGAHRSVGISAALSAVR